MNKTKQTSSVRHEVKHTRTAKVTLSFPKELYLEIEAAAKQDDRAVANWVVRAAKEKLERMSA